MLRQIYYWLPPLFRFVLRYIWYLPSDLFYPNKTIPPRRLIYTGRGDFEKQGKQWLDFFKTYVKLRPEHRVLDIGSGIGRIALPLSTYLSHSYDGFDVVRLGVQWCKKNISTIYPDFRFLYINIHNDLYKSNGSRAETFLFPYPNESFDFICAISVFTHLTPKELENYIKESVRVASSNAKMVFTFFVLNETSIHAMKQNNTAYQFLSKQNEYHALMNDKVKAANVAYQEPYLENLLQQNNLKIISKSVGYWSTGQASSDLAFQDIWVIEKI